MKVYTVHEPSQTRTSLPGGRREAALFVKEGFCWPALFFPAIWQIWHGMWWVLLGWLAVGALLGLAGELTGLPESALVALSLLFTLWFALEANTLRRWTLARRGWRMVGVAAGRDLEEAERSFFARHSGAPAVPAVRPRGPAARPATGPAAPYPGIGLFPEPK